MNTTTTEPIGYLARPERALIDATVDHIYDLLLSAAGHHCPYTGLFDPIAEALAALLDAAEQSTQRGVASQLDEFEGRLDACEAIAQQLAGRSEVSA